MFDVKADYGLLHIPILSGSPRAPKPAALLGQLDLNLPTFEYQTRKFVPVPFDRRMTDGKFDDINHAMQFICHHCIAAHGRFDKQLARLYIQFCQIFSFADGGYVPGSLVPKSIFDNAFRSIGR